MSLSDRLAEGTPDEPQDPQFVPRTEFDGASGFIQTGPLTDAPDHDEILEQFGYDPAKVYIVGHPRVSKWQQRARIRGTSDYETTWLSAYKFVLASKGFAVDLPALYAEVAKSKKDRTVKPKLDAATVVVAWADVQVGKVDHMGGLTELLERLDDKRNELEQYLRKAKYDHIVVADVGDIIEGFSNFAAQHRTNSLSMMDQVDVAAVEFWKTIRLCAKFAPVDVLSIPSNHCAWRRDGKMLAGKPT
ncbi:MAG: hypothetical protein WCJ18_01490, partial [Planctomycetota bacterium]